MKLEFLVVDEAADVQQTRRSPCYQDQDLVLEPAAVADEGSADVTTWADKNSAAAAGAAAASISNPPYPSEQHSEIVVPCHCSWYGS